SELEAHVRVVEARAVDRRVAAGREDRLGPGGDRAVEDDAHVRELLAAGARDLDRVVPVAVGQRQLRVEYAVLPGRELPRWRLLDGDADRRAGRIDGRAQRDLRHVHDGRIGRRGDRDGDERGAALLRAHVVAQLLPVRGGEELVAPRAEQRVGGDVALPRLRGALEAVARGGELRAVQRRELRAGGGAPPPPGPPPPAPPPP